MVLHTYASINHLAMLTLYIYCKMIYRETYENLQIESVKYNLYIRNMLKVQNNFCLRLYVYSSFYYLQIFQVKLVLC